jgi:hypothetical protein
MKIILIVAILLAVPMFIAAQTPDPVADDVNVQDLYLAKDDGKGNAGEAVTVFTTTDIPIYCVVQLDSSKPATVKMNLVAAKVPGVKTDTKVVTTTYTTKDGQNRVNFSGKPAGKWVAGTYRVDIFIDGKPARALDFQIKDSSVKVATAELFQPAASDKPKPAVHRKKN